MPYQRVDSEMFDEIVNEVDPEDLPDGFADKRPSGAFEYESAEATLKPAKLGPVAKAVRDALVKIGATKLKVRYDGGYDEGFSHPDQLIFGDTRRDAKSFGKEFGTAELVAAVRDASKKGSPRHVTDFYSKSDDKAVATNALEQLADEYASTLLGDGFGTGEYQLYGAFTADLVSGEIVDHKDVEKPANME